MFEKAKYKKLLARLFLPIFLFTILCLAPTSESNINYASISPPLDLGKKFLRSDLAYSFNVASKLNGKGLINLMVRDGNIKGVAKSSSSICNCQIDFITKLSGKVDKSSGLIKVNVDGIGSPKSAVPGKVNFKGPLSGSLEGDKLILNGPVKIKGWLAGYAGFKNSEMLVIEISDSNIVKALKSTKFGVALVN